MSNAPATITFKDGTVFYGEYAGSIDRVNSLFFETEEERDEKWRQDQSEIIESMGKPDDAEVVEVYTSYGGGFSWNAVASKSQKRVLAYFDVTSADEEDYLGGTNEYRHILDKG